MHDKNLKYLPEELQVRICSGIIWMEYMLESDADTFVSVYEADFFWRGRLGQMGRFPFLCTAFKITKIGYLYKQIGELRYV